MEFDFKDGLITLDRRDIGETLNFSKRFAVFIEDGLDAGKISEKIRGAKGIIVCIQGLQSTEIKDVRKIGEMLSKNAKKDAKIMWSFGISNKEKIMVMASW